MKKIELITQLEQYETLVLNMAIITGGYYNKLISENVPVDLAEELTKAFHLLLWQKLQQG